MLQSVCIVSLCALSFIAFYGYGSCLCRFFALNAYSMLHRILTALALGIAVVTMLLFCASLAGLLCPAAAWILLGGGLLLGVGRLRYGCNWRNCLSVVRGEWSQVTWPAMIAGGMLVLQLVVNLLLDLSPTTNGDTVNMYFLAPAYWIRAGCYWQPSSISMAAAPGMIMHLSAFGMLLESPLLAQVLAGWGMGALAALVVYVIARDLGGPSAGVFGAAIFYFMPVICHWLALSGKVDLGWTFFEGLALVSLLEWWRNPLDVRHLRCAGLFSGLALDCKYTAVIYCAIAVLVVVCLSVQERDFAALSRRLLVLLVPVLLMSSPYLLYNAWVHGEPLFPAVKVTLFLAKWVFGTQVAESGGLIAARRHESGLSGILRLPWWLSMLPYMNCTRSFGPLFLALLPFAIPDLWRNPRTRRWLIHAGMSFVVIYLVHQRSRQFLPGLMLLSASVGVAVGGGGNWTKNWRPVAFVTVCIVNGYLLLYSFAHAVADGSLSAAVGYLSRDTVLERRQRSMPTYIPVQMIRYINSHLRGSDRILLSRSNKTHLVDCCMLFMSDIGVTDISDAQMSDALIRQHGITHLLIGACGSAADVVLPAAGAGSKWVLIFESKTHELYRLDRSR